MYSVYYEVISTRSSGSGRTIWRSGQSPSPGGIYTCPAADQECVARGFPWLNGGTGEGPGHLTVRPWVPQDEMLTDETGLWYGTPS